MIGAPPVVPELDVSDLARSLAAYEGVLGFECRVTRTEERFAYLVREGAHLMLQEAAGPGRRFRTAPLAPPFGRGVNLQIEVSDVDALHAAVARSDLVIHVPLEERWYRQADEEAGVRQFVVADPDGYLLRFGSDLGRRAAGTATIERARRPSRNVRESATMLLQAGKVVIETPRLRLRHWRDEDLVPFAALNADPRVMRHFPAVLDRGESDAMVGRIRAHMAEQGFGLWAVSVAGEADFIGFVGLSRTLFEARFTPCVEVGWRLAFEHWGRGYAAEAARAALAHGFGPLGLDEIVAMTVPANRRSLAVMRHLGMTRSPDDDFLHPSLPNGHPLQPHVLHRLKRSE